MKRYRVIVNPAAGHGNGLRSIPAIEKWLAHYNLPYDLIRTERPGQAVELARQAAMEGVEVVVAAGGDGTINEVLNGLMQPRQAGANLPALGVLCVGRGNDFSYGANIPTNLEEACRVLAEDRRRWMDIGRVTGGIYPQGRYFINVVGVGFDAIGTIEAARMPRWGGFASFLIPILKTIFLYNHAPLARIEFDGQTIIQRSLMISVMNGRRIGGGGFIMAPEGEPDDGMFDLVIAEQMSSFRIFGLIPHFMKGTASSQAEIKIGRANRVTITAQDGPLPTQADGEIICTEGMRLEIELLPRQVEVICSPQGKAG